MRVIRNLNKKSIIVDFEEKHNFSSFEQLGWEIIGVWEKEHSNPEDDLISDNLRFKIWRIIPDKNKSKAEEMRIKLFKLGKGVRISSADELTEEFK